MANQFIRDYNLSFIGESQTRVIKDLRITFEVVKSSQSYANLLTLEIYNPSGATIEFINGQDPLVVFNAGYKDNLGLIFKGRITNVLSVRQGVDRVLQIFAADGQRNLEKAIINKTYSDTVTIQTVVTDLLKSIQSVNNDLVLGANEFDDTTADRLRGQTISGSSKKFLDKLGRDYNFKWSIQNHEITIKKMWDKPLAALEAVMIKQSTGMIGSPTLTREAGGFGVAVTSLLNPNLAPDRAFIIESETAAISAGGLRFKKVKPTNGSGNYRAYEVTHTGDTHTPAWYSVVKGRGL